MLHNKTQGWHAHVYINSNVFKVDLLRENLANFIKPKSIKDYIKTICIRGIDIGDIHWKPIGPHPQPQFAIWFDDRWLGDMIRWLTCHRAGFNVLIHPIMIDRPDEIRAHTEMAIWLGTKLELDLDKL